MAFLKSSQLSLGPKTVDVKGFTQATTLKLGDRSYTEHEVLLADNYSIVGDVTVSDDLIISKLSDDGEDITITGDTTTRTISGAGSIQGATLAQTPNSTLTGMSGTPTSINLDNATGWPVGHVIQTKAATNNNKYTFVSTAFTEIHTGNRVSITPTSTTNKLFMQFWMPVSGGGTSQLWNFDIYDVTGGTQVEPKGQTGNINRCHFSHRGSHHDANDMDVLIFGLWADIARTTETIYTIRGQNRDGATVFYVNHSSSTGADWANTGVTTFVIQEIQQ